jgi:hypothetical protein
MACLDCGHTWKLIGGELVTVLAIPGKEAS